MALHLLQPRWLAVVAGGAAVVIAAGASAAPAKDGGTPSADAAPAAEIPIAFPGQYAPWPPGYKFSAQPKSCRGITDLVERAACLDHIAFDWPSLERYAAANLALGTAKPAEKRVVFLGDSITDNWSKPVAGGFFRGKPYVNRGIGGQTTGQMLVRFRPDVIALAPKVVVILAGTNDLSGNAGPSTPEAIEDNLASMAELAQANGIHVVLASLLPIRDDKLDGNGKPRVRSKERPPDVIRALNRWIGEYARKHHHGYLDYHASMVDARGFLRAELTEDGLHPNAAGYAIMAPLAERAIAAALGH
jgi:lysophospholipase L1-like esterase